MLRCIILSSFFLLVGLSLKAQHEKRDSAFLYRKIETFSDKRKFTHLIYKSIFRFDTPLPVLVVKGVKKISKPKPYSYFEGKVIRNIHIVTYDPFGYNPNDTSIIPDGFLFRAGNAMHVKTMPIRIRNILIVKKYDTFDSLRVKESERLVRSQSFVREAFISSVLKNDSVDMYIRVYDVWSIIIIADGSPTNFTINFKEKNVLGTGHQFQDNFKQNIYTGKNSNSSDYYIPNIYNTFITSAIHYNIDENKNYGASVSLNRPFYSIFTSWAGGISLQRQLDRAILKNFDSTQFVQTYKSNTQDYWLGH